MVFIHFRRLKALKEIERKLREDLAEIMPRFRKLEKENDRLEDVVAVRMNSNTFDEELEKFEALAYSKSESKKELYKNSMRKENRETVELFEKQLALEQEVWALKKMITLKEKRLLGVRKKIMKAIF